MIRICLEVKEREEDGYKDGKYYIYKKIFLYIYMKMYSEMLLCVINIG